MSGSRPLKWSTLREHAAYAAMFAALPFAHIYTYLSAVGKISYMQGAIAGASLIAFSITAICAIQQRMLGSRLLLVSLALQAYIFAHIWFLKSSGPIIGPDVDPILIGDNIFILLRNSAYLIVGVSLTNVSPYRRLSFMAWLAMTANALGNISATSISIDLTGASDDLAGLYLFLGDTYAVWSIVVLASVSSRRTKALVSLTSIVTLYVLSSRTALYAFVPVLVVLWFLVFDAKKNRRPQVILGGMLSAIVMVLLLSQTGTSDEIWSSRMFRFFSEGEDASWAFRAMQLDIGLRDISTHPFFGAFGSDYRIFNRFGDYIHSFLEVWRQFGVVPFVWIVGLLFATAKEWRTRLRLATPSSADVLLIGSFVFNAVEVGFSRTWGTPYIFLSIGLAAQLASTRYSVRGRELVARSFS